MNVEALITRLQGVRRSASGWQALCPAHADRNPSLSIDVCDERILVYCHAGCSQGAVLSALGVDARELFLDASDSKARIVAEYPYTDENGGLLFQVVRLEPKDFRQRRPDGNGGWTWNLNGARRVIYRLPEVLTAEFVLVCEGEKDCEAAHKLGIVATCNPGGAGKWRKEYSECLRGKQVAIIADVDPPGRAHAQRVAVSLHLRAESVKVLELPGAKDLTEWVERGGTKDALLKLTRNAPDWKPSAIVPGEVPLVAVAAEELLAREIKPREMLLDPILPEQGLGLLYSYRGIGKTFLALGVGVAVASAGCFLRWTAPRARRVLYVDGELPAKTVQERIAMVLAGLEGCEPGANMLRIITPDLQKRPMPDLATAEGQRLLEPELDGVDLVVLDNLSALCRDGNENEGEGWLPVQDWALGLRRRGMSVLFLHHAGKNKSQRGTSRREDLLDTVITLKHPSNYDPSEGLRCEVHFEKTRSMLGEAAKPFEVRLHSGPEGQAIWTMGDLEETKAQRAFGMFDSAATVRDVAEELAISKSAAGRLRQRWEREHRSSQRPRL
jgi:hypothetical protein